MGCEEQGVSGVYTNIIIVGKSVVESREYLNYNYNNNYYYSWGVPEVFTNIIIVGEWVV